MLLIYTSLVSFLQYYKLNYFVSVCLIIVVLIPLITYIVSPNLRNFEKVSAYECGFEPFDDSKSSFDIHFFIIAVLFVVFDLEIVYVFPWASVLFYVGPLGFWSMMVFLGLLTVGFVYEWKCGALDWVTKLPVSLRNSWAIEPTRKI